MSTNLAIGLGAGLLSALLFASASTGTVLGLFVLFFLSPLPIAVAGLGWGWRSAAAAALAAIVAIAIIVAPRAAAFHGFAIGAPTALLSYLALLNRSVTTDTGTTAIEWYPLGRIVATAAILAGSLGAIGLLTTASDVEGLRDMLHTALERMFTRPPGAPAAPKGSEANTVDQVNALTGVMIGLFTASQATMWFIVAMLNLWLAGHVVARSDRLVRPWPDLSALRLPPAMPIVLAVALAASFAPGFPGMIGSGYAAAILVAYVTVGLAIVHSVTRGHPMRPAILSGTYAGLLVFAVIAAPVLALIGLAEPFSPLRRQPPQGPSTT